MDGKRGEEGFQVLGGGVGFGFCSFVERENV